MDKTADTGIKINISETCKQVRHGLQPYHPHPPLRQDVELVGRSLSKQQARKNMKAFCCFCAEVSFH